MYTYTADGLRVQQAVGGTATTFAWDWATGVPELLTDGDKLYLIGHDTLGWADAAGWIYAMPDALGSVRQVTDVAGKLVDAREWSPYGVEAGEAQEGLGYTGEWWDAAVGLQYLRARWYDAQSGRFTQVDPWKGHLSRPSTLNGFSYVSGNPVRLLDPMGLCEADPYDPYFDYECWVLAREISQLQGGGYAEYSRWSYEELAEYYVVATTNCRHFVIPSADVHPGHLFSSPSTCFALNWVERRVGIFELQASRYGVPPELVAGLLAAEIDLDHTLPGRMLDSMARAAYEILSRYTCLSDLRTVEEQHAWAQAQFYWQRISQVGRYYLNIPGMGRKDVGDIVSGDSAVHHETYVIVEDYMTQRYGQPTPYGVNKPDYLPWLLTDHGTIEFTARMARMLADYRTGSQAPHQSDLGLFDMAQIWAAWRAGIGGVTCPAARGCGFRNLQEFQEKSDLGGQAQLGYPYFRYFRDYFASR